MSKLVFPGMAGGRRRALFFAWWAGLTLLSGCAAPDLREAAHEPPMFFHDPRLQYALLADDRSMLERDFRMSTPSEPVERGVAALLLPITVATDIASLPLTLPVRVLSGLGSPPPGKKLD